MEQLSCTQHALSKGVNASVVIFIKVECVRIHTAILLWEHEVRDEVRKERETSSTYEDFIFLYINSYWCTLDLAHHGTFLLLEES